MLHFFAKVDMMLNLNHGEPFTTGAIIVWTQPWIISLTNMVLPLEQMGEIIHKRRGKWTKLTGTCLRNLDLLADSLLDCFLRCLLSSRSSCLGTKSMREQFIADIFPSDQENHDDKNGKRGHWWFHHWDASNIT